MGWVYTIECTLFCVLLCCIFTTFSRRSFCRVDQKLWGEQFFFRFFRPQRPTTMGTEIFTFSWRRLVHPFTGLDSIGFFDLIAQRRLRLNCRSGMRTYYPYTMSTLSSSLIYVPCLFLTRSLTLSRTLRVTGRSCAWEWEAKQHAASTCDHMIYV